MPVREDADCTPPLLRATLDDVLDEQLGVALERFQSLGAPRGACQGASDGGRPHQVAHRREREDRLDPTCEIACRPQLSRSRQHDRCPWPEPALDVEVGDRWQVPTVGRRGAPGRQRPHEAGVLVERGLQVLRRERRQGADGLTLEGPRQRKHLCVGCDPQSLEGVTVARRLDLEGDGREPLIELPHQCRTGTQPTVDQLEGQLVEDQSPVTVREGPVVARIMTVGGARPQVQLGKAAVMQPDRVGEVLTPHLRVEDSLDHPGRRAVGAVVHGLGRHVSCSLPSGASP